MNIKLTEYIGASTIALSIKDVPMTALPGIKDAFVRLCETVETHREPVYHGQVVTGMVLSDETSLATAALESLTAGEVMQPVEAPADDKPRRGRPKKVETVEDKEPAGEPTTTPDAFSAPVNTAEVSPNGLTSAEPTGEPESVLTPASPEPTTELPDITDSELQKYCAKLAAHFGDPKKVFDLAQPFVPEGAVARPTNIKDNAQRHAFIQAAEAASGVKYHG